MKNPIVQLLLILGLVAVAGTAYNFANSGTPKFLPWNGAKYYGDRAFAVEAPRPAEKTPASAAGGTAVKTTEPAGAAAAPSEFKLLDLKATLEELDNGTPFVDARRTNEYEAGHIPGAVSICPYEQGDLDAKINKIREDAVLAAPIVVYCTNSNECESSKLIAVQLKLVGFIDIMIYSGGFPEWQKEKPDRIAKGPTPGKWKE